LNTASFNTAIGDLALASNTIGTSNTAVGTNALEFNTTGIANIALGDGAGSGVSTADAVICIGASGANVSNSCYIGQIFGATSSGGTAVFINSDGKLGTTTSSRRFKDEIKPMEHASEALFALKPVTFRYKKGIDPQGIPQFGLVAEDVEKVNPDLVVRDKEGKVNTVRYEAVNAMLLNEFLKEHKAFFEEQSKVQKLEAALEAVNKRLKEQDARIEKVSAELKAGTPQIVSD
jgi:endosialidase-like protein